jgi:protein-S-isoprenylcysteine O-methyltransferase Ste14
MRTMKTVVRVLLVLFIIGAGFQVLLAAIGFIGAFSFASANPEAFGGRAGTLVGTLIVLILLIWAFRKLGAKPEQISNQPTTPAT